MYHWLLVEGIYLYVMVGVVYNTARVKMWMYKILGWGAPALIVSLWAVFASYVMEDQVCKKRKSHVLRVACLRACFSCLRNMHKVFAKPDTRATVIRNDSF